jgi:hypothetical protein
MGGVIFDAHYRSRRLGKPSTVGLLTLQAPEDPLVEWRRGDPRSLDVIEKFESWPIIVCSRRDRRRGTSQSGSRGLATSASRRGIALPGLG